MVHYTTLLGFTNLEGVALPVRGQLGYSEPLEARAKAWKAATGHTYGHGVATPRLGVGGCCHEIKELAPYRFAQYIYQRMLPFISIGSIRITIPRLNTQ